MVQKEKETQTRNLSVLARTNHELVQSWLGMLAADNPPVPAGPHLEEKGSSRVNEILEMINPQDVVWDLTGPSRCRTHATIRFTCLVYFLKY